MPADYDCSCWCDYPNQNHRYYGCSYTPKKERKWKCVDCYEYVGKSKFGATHCRRKDVDKMNIDNSVIDRNALALISQISEKFIGDAEIDEDEIFNDMHYIAGVIAMADRMREALEIK